MILNTFDHLGKFDAKGDEGYFVGYSLSSKAFRVFNKRTKKVEENLHVDFLENKLIKKGASPNWLFDIDTLTNYINYVPVVVAGTSSTNISGIKEVASKAVKKDVSSLSYIALLNWFHEAHMETRNNDAPNGCNADDTKSSGISNPTTSSNIPSADQVEPIVSLTVESKNLTVSLPIPTVCLDISPKSKSDPRLISKGDFSQKETPSLDNALTFSNRFEDTFRMKDDLSNMETSIPASPTPTFRIHKDHPKSQIISPVDTPVQTKHKSKEMEEQKPKKIFDALKDPSWVEAMQEELLQFKIQIVWILVDCPKGIFDALKDPSWIEAMQEELLQFKIQIVWILVDCPKGVRPIGTKWVLKNKKDERGIVIRNKARIVAQGYTQEEGINYEEVLAPVARIEAIRLFLAYASFMCFIVYQMDVKSVFLYGTIDEEVYVMQPPGFQDPEFPNRVYKVEKAMGTINQTLFIRKHKQEFLLVQVYVDDIIFGSSNPQLCREFKALMHDKFQMSAMGKLTFFLGLQVLQKKDGIFLSQDKYVGDILKKFGYSDVRSANTPMDKENPWGKDRPSKHVELHLYRSMIRSLMYLTASRPDIMFAVCACARHQVTPKECHLYAVKRIFRYLKGHPKLGLWYPKESPFDLVAYSDSDYGGATQDRKSTTSGCQFLGRRMETMNQETKILATVDGKLQTIFESSLRRHLKLNDEEVISSLPDAELFKNLSLMGYNILPNQRFTFQKGQFSHQWKFFIHTIMQCLSPKSTDINEFSSNIATVVPFPTVSSLDVGQDRENISKTSTLPHESSPMVTSLDADEGSMQQRIHKLMELCTSLQRQQSQMAAKIKDQDLEISGLKARVKSLEDKNRRSTEPTQEEAPIIREIIEIWEELGADKSTKLGSNDTKEMVNVLSSIDAANILTSRGAAASVSSAKVLPAAGVPTVSGSFPTVSAIFTTASVKLVESEVPKKRKLQEQIDAQVAKEMEEEFARESQRLSEQLARDSEIARLHAKEELKIMIEGLDRNNEVIAKHLQEYEQAEADLSVGEKLELISELMKYQDHRAKILKGMTLEQIKEKFTPVWKQFEDFVPMNSKEESERVRRQGLKIDQGSSKRMKTSKSVSEEELKRMMQLVHLEEVYIEALQLWTLVKETFSIRQATKDKEKEL
nr:hypothetical protein [Tanacetum cinerariifolium]